MKHIDIIPNYSGITDMIKNGEIAPNFFVKSSNDEKVYFSNSNGYQLRTSAGTIYNMYYIGDDIYVGVNTGKPIVEADFDSSHGFSFQILENGLPITANLDVYVGADCLTTEDSLTGITNFSYEADWGVTSLQVKYFAGQGLVQITGEYTPTDQEMCEECEGGTWYDDDEGGYCVLPSEPDDCTQYEDGTEERCNCEGRYWWGDECHDEEEPAESEPEESE